MDVCEGLAQASYEEIARAVRRSLDRQSAPTSPKPRFYPSELYTSEERCLEKKKYRTKHQAIVTLHVYRRTLPAYTKQRVYRCNCCKKWHTTSILKKEMA
jgi:hypothetical protein